MVHEQRLELVKGPMNLVLHAGRLCGIAPVTFHQNGINLSRKLIFVSFLYITVCDMTEIIGLIMDILLTGTTDGYRTPTVLNTIIWLPDLGLNMVSGTYGVLGAPWRMKCIIKYMDLLEQIKLQLNLRGTELRTGIKRRILFIVMVTMLSMLAAFDYIVFLLDGINMQKDMTIVYLYCGFYGQFSMWILLEMQYVIAALTVNDLQKALNAHLDHVLALVSNDRVFISSSMVSRIRHLAVVFNGISSVVRQVDEAHGPVLFILIMILIMDLIVTPYYVMVALIQGEGATVDFILMILWCVFLLINFAVIIEPAHRTEAEYDRTCRLISFLTCHVSAIAPLSIELDSFFEQLLLNHASYSLIGVAPLNRTLVATIFVTVTTYLVIVIQFHITQASNNR